MARPRQGTPAVVRNFQTQEWVLAYLEIAPDGKNATIAPGTPYIALPPGGKDDLPHFWGSQVMAASINVQLPDGSTGCCWLHVQADWDQFAQEAATFVRALSGL